MYKRQTQSFKRTSLEPKSRDRGVANRLPRMAMTSPAAIFNIMIMVKVPLALSGRPSPIFLATMALLPVESMTLKPSTILMMGYTILMEDRALVLTYLETNTPSTMVYRDMTTIMMVVGMANISKDPKVNFFDNE